MPSPNKPIVSTLIETVKTKIENAKLYDALQKMNVDINKTYEALFDGPLPKNNGKNLDLTELPRTSLPPKIAFTDVTNIFTEHQIIQTNSGLVSFKLNASGAQSTRVEHVEIGGVLASIFGRNLSHNGAAWVTDDGTNNGAVFISNGLGSLIFRQMVAGVLVDIIIVALDGIIRIGAPTVITGAGVGDVLLVNTKGIRSVNAATTNTLSMIFTDAFDLVQLGSKSTGNTNPNGSPAIPTVANADLPAAGANNNGIILIDKTNHRICWWDSGNRYYAAGTAF